MRRLVSLVLSVIIAAALSLTAFAEEKNLLSDYSAGWSGGEIVYDKDHGTINLTEIGAASREFAIRGAKGLYFYFDMGNYSGKGTGSVILEFLSVDKEVISSCVTESDPQNGSFRRYKLGDEGAYITIPEEAEKVKITLNFTEGESSPFFRNFFLDMNSDSIRYEGSVGFTASGNLTLVQNKVSNSQYWIMVIFVFLVALGMFFVRKALDKTKNK